MTPIMFPLAVTVLAFIYAVFETVRNNKAADRFVKNNSLLAGLVGSFLIGGGLLFLWALVLIVVLVAWLLYFAFT